MKAAAAPSASSAPIGQNLTSLIGNTPLLRLERLCPRGNLFAKAEWTNPGQSVKDRAVWGIVQAALKDGRLAPGKVILDATSGNTGIAYAMLGAAMGYPVRLCMPGGVTSERRKILSAYGAELILTDPQLFSDGAILKARELYRESPELYFYGDQYSNEANWRAHFQTTGPEIWTQTHGRVAHFVAVLGTSGTFVGTGRYLKSRNPAVRLTEVQPDSAFHGLEGMKHMPSSIVPPIYDPALADRKMAVHTEEAYRWVKDAARREGLLLGISSGAALAAALKVADDHPSQVVVTLFPDGGVKYLSERFWDGN
jgi:cysteine synthase B